MGGKGQDLYRKAKTIIPGGTQLLSKRPEMFLPEHWPAYYSKAKGVDVWDLDGNHYIDMLQNGVGACILGAADPDVDAAVKAAIDKGTMSTLNCPEEVELAELLCEIHPWAEQVRFARGGGEAMAIAVRIARASTKKDRIAFCGYHGWHDWYLSANLSKEDALKDQLLPGLNPRGVPSALQNTALPFHYNRVDELKDIVKKYGNTLAAIVMEPIRMQQPKENFLKEVREIASSLGVPLIFDEVSVGFRLATGGAHLTLDVEPDIAIFSKALGNGYPIAAIIGRKDVMDIAQDTFISSTSWTERIGPTAALAMIRKHQQYNVHEHLISIGTAVQEVWKTAAKEVGLLLKIKGIPPLSHFSIQHKQARAAHTLFTQFMLERGFLAGTAFYATYAHTKEHITDYRNAVTDVFNTLAKTLEEGKITEAMKGPEAHEGFYRLS